MIDLSFPTMCVAPALVMFSGALLLALVRPAVRPLILLLAPVSTLWAIWNLGDGVLLQTQFLGNSIELVEADRLRRLFATVFALMAFAGGLFALRQASRFELSSAYAYAAAAIGVCFAGDLITLFVFWELMAVFSTIVVAAGNTKDARQAAVRYGVLHLLGGVVFMLGIEGIMVQTGSIDIRAIALDSVAAWLLLTGVLINAAAPPLSAWIADAYPEASPSGSVFLSAFTTKSAVLALILLFPGATVLIPIGIAMIFYGIVYALLENDIRRILAYSIINQVGFMVVGVGIGTELAINGAAAHAFAHILYKGLLFMSAGAVIFQTGKRQCTDLGGLFQSMPVTTLCGIIGALSISAFPLTSGFIAKSMISQSAADQHLAVVWYLLTAASAGVFLHAGIKFPWFVFFQKDSGLRPPDPPWNMQAAMFLLAALCLGLGIFPGLLYGLLPYPVDYVPYTAGHVLSQLQLLLFAGLAFFVMLPWMQRTLTISLDFDWFYRQLIPTIANQVETGWDRFKQIIEAFWQRHGSPVVDRFLDPHRSRGWLARTWPTGSMALWVAALLVLVTWFGQIG